MRVTQSTSLWLPVQFTPLPLPPALQVYRDRLRLLYPQGRVEVLHAQAAGADPLFERFTWDHWLQSGLVDELWQHEPFASLLAAEPDDDSKDDFVACSGYELAARLAQVLGLGGAVAPSQPLTMVQAFDLGVPAAAALLPDADDLAVMSEAPWCDFFVGAGWDLTVISACKETETITVLLATDSD